MHLQNVYLADMSYSIEPPAVDASAPMARTGPDAERFYGAGAKSYDARIRRIIPGYSVLQELIAPVLTARIGRGEASILLSGVGTGAELSELAFQSTHWCFTAVDPSPDMLAIAGRRAEMLGCIEQVDFRVSTLAGYHAHRPHDAALSVLVAHFLPDDGEKLQYFRDLADRVKPGAPLILADLAAVYETDPRPALSRWMESVSPDPSMATRVVERMARDFHPVGEARLAELLDEAGFSAPVRFFQALDIAAYVTGKRTG